MRDRDTFTGPRRGAASLDAEFSRETSAVVRQLIATARDESPTPLLQERVLEGIAYRRLLANAQTSPMAVSTGRRMTQWFAGVATLAAATSAALWLHSPADQSKVPIAQEAPTTRFAVQSPGPSASSKPAPDPCRQHVAAAGKQPLIDDFEDGDDAVLDFESRSGLWRWARDTDGPGSAPALLPIPRVGAKAGNQMALHVKGGRLLEWGAVVEFNFKPSCYDASVYQGLSFQAKGPGRIFVAPREVGTIPETEGGTCTQDCYNPHVKKVELDRQWKTYRIEWSEFEQRGYGRPPFDPKQLHSIAFLIRTEDTPYDLWFDDVSFFAFSIQTRRLPH